jgi:hypothetical protein
MADLNRILQAAAQAVLEDQASGSNERSPKKRKGLTTPRAMLIGAGMFTAGRLLVRGRSNGLVESLQERLTPDQDEDADDYVEDDEEFEDEEPYDEADEGPDDEYDDESEDEYDEEPEAEYDDEELEEEEPEEERSGSARSSR